MILFDKEICFQERKNDVLAVGELLIDMIATEYGDDFQCSTYKKFFGGSPANIAMNVKKLGVNSLIASAVGDDGLGRYLTKHIQEAGLDTSLIDKVDFSTSMVMVTKSKNSPTPIFYRGADYNLGFTSHLEEAVANSKIVHFSCWPLSRNPVRNTIEKVIEAAKKYGSLLCFDPNYHPMIWEKGEAGIDYVKSIIGKVHIVKPSEDDAERLFGKDEPEKQINKFLDLGAKLVVMTLGKDGAIASNGIETIKFNTMATEIVDTTGAGDAFWSGFYAAVVKGHTIKEALDLGFAVSAYKLKYLGAIVELPDLEVIKEMYGF
ncbi:carbohydrate kinase family protein [Alloiococcus sp. CFN-8]|uniref:carbohydrate kinase family protein n=1 Tax=Alloiococcus sp. CFN-8 TaxID=3416081 RepID=UPI003CEA2EF9